LNSGKGDLVAESLCPWDVYHKEQCENDGSPECYQQCLNERTLRNELEKNELRQKIVLSTYNYEKDIYGLNSRL
jgi:hypothetical protein